MGKKLFALVDCNNFYASCERVFNPVLKGKPVVVLSNNDGCVIARSEEAKALGIRMGHPLFECRPIILKHHVHVFSSNFSLYGDISRRVMETLGEFTPDMEIYSIDEAFLDLTGITDDPTGYGRTVRSTVKKWTGIPASVGLAPTNTLAKVAAKIAKKTPENDGVFNIAGHEEEILSSFEVGDIWGIGWQYAKMLRRRGILTALDLIKAPDSWIRKHLTVAGMRTVMELRGVSCIDLDEVEKPRKSILCSRSFGRRVSRLDELREAVAAYTSRGAEKLREQHSAASCVQIFIIEFPFNDGHPRTHICTTELPVATAYTPELIRYAKAMLERIYRPHCEYRKAGVMLSGICRRGQVQTNLFHDSREGEKELALMQAVDEVNRRWGRGSLIHAASGFSRPWWMRQAHRSPRFTTSWNDLPRTK